MKKELEKKLSNLCCLKTELENNNNKIDEVIQNGSNIISLAYDCEMYDNNKNIIDNTIINIIKASNDMKRLLNKVNSQIGIYNDLLANCDEED